MQFLLEIEDVFDIGGRGCLLVPAVPDAFQCEVRAGEQLLVVTGQGEQVRSIVAFEMIEPRRALGLRAALPSARRFSFPKPPAPDGQMRTFRMDV